MKNTKSISFPDMVSPITRQIKLSSGIQSIQESLISLLSTSKGELLGDPQYGTNILKYVYDTNDTILADILKTEISRAVKTYEPRVRVEEQDIHINRDLNNNVMYVIINYYVISDGYDGYVEVKFEL